jgi:hypothetical protein
MPERKKVSTEDDRGESAEPPALAAGFPFTPIPGKKVLVIVQDEEGPAREFEDLMLRRVPSGVAHHFRGAGGARGLTHAQYLSALVGLHEALRQRADGGDETAAELLSQFGLQTVSI